MAEVAAETKECKCCGCSYAETDGRVHGACFTCNQCRNVEQLIRRNLGTTADMAEWSSTEVHDFFGETKTQDSRLKWTTIRASWIKKSTEATIRKFASIVEKQPLPKSVWLQRGFEEAVIDRFEPKWSDEYGTHVHELPIATLRWEDARETIESKVLELEKAAAKKKSKGKGDDDLDLPETCAEDEKDDGKEERAQAAKQRKILSGNQKIAAAAARAMGSLCTGEATLVKLLAKAEAAATADEASKKVCQESLSKCRQWGTAARAAINAQELNKALPPDAIRLPLDPLPFDAAELKIMLQQSNAGCKSLRESLPKPKGKAKEEPAEANGAEKPKRRRTKGPGN